MNTECSRRLCIATAIAFLVATLFPVGAGLSKNTASLPHWWGTTDVGTAFLLAALVLAVLAVGTPRVTKQDGGCDLSCLPHTDPRDIRAVGRVFAFWGPRRVESMPVGICLAVLAVVVRLACLDCRLSVSVLDL